MLAVCSIDNSFVAVEGLDGVDVVLNRSTCISSNCTVCGSGSVDGVAGSGCSSGNNRSCGIYVVTQ